MGLLARALALLFCLALASPALADKAKCIAAHEAGQAERKQGKLLAARVSLGVCAEEACPGPVRADCAKWLGEVETGIPTLVVRVRDEAGKDLPSAVVTFDGATITLDGLPLRVDPGKHVFVARRADGTSRTATVVVAEAEHDRPVTLTFEADKTTATARRSVAPFVLGGVGILALAGFTVVGLTTNARVRELEDSCAPRCDPADKDAVARRYLVGDVLLGAGVVAIGAAITVYVLDRPTTAAVGPTHGGGFASVRFAF